MFRKCSSCLLLKALDEFYKNPMCKMNRSYICDRCSRLKAKEYYWQNFDSLKVKKQIYYKKNKERFAEYQRNYRKSKRMKVS